MLPLDCLACDILLRRLGEGVMDHFCVLPEMDFFSERATLRLALLPTNPDLQTEYVVLQGVVGISAPVDCMAAIDCRRFR